MPAAALVLCLAIFCLNTTEVMVAGLLPSLSDGLGVSVTAAGNLVTVFALGMVFGGPLLTLVLMRAPRKTAMVLMMVLFLAGQTIGALATAYWTMVIARVVTALATAAFFGLAASVCAGLVPPDRTGRALAIVFGGFMVANVFGLPLATFIDQLMGWRAAFWAVDILVALCHDRPLSLVALFLLGFTGLPLNPAMAARVMSLSSSGALISTMNTAAVCAGITVGTWLAGVGIDAFGYRAPMWAGAPLALGAPATLLLARITGRRHVERARPASALPDPETASRV